MSPWVVSGSTSRSPERNKRPAGFFLLSLGFCFRDRLSLSPWVCSMLLDLAHMVAHTRVSVCSPAASPYISKKFCACIYLFPIPPNSSHPYCDSLLEENCYWCTWYRTIHSSFWTMRRGSVYRARCLSLPLPQLPTLSSFSPGSLPFPFFSLFLSSSFAPSLLPFLYPYPSFPAFLSLYISLQFSCLSPSFLSPSLSCSPSSFLP